jgi:hypothetical protein
MVIFRIRDGWMTVEEKHGERHERAGLRFSLGILSTKDTSYLCFTLARDFPS